MNNDMHDDTRNTVNDAQGHVQTSVGRTHDATRNHASIKIQYNGFEYEAEMDFEQMESGGEHESYGYYELLNVMPPRMAFRFFKFIRPYNYKGRVIDHRGRQT
jgi:hypothetical protein